MALLSILPDLLVNIPLLVFAFIIRMHFPIFHDMIDLKKKQKIG